MTIALLLLCFGGCAYAYAGYPLALLLLSRFRPRPVKRADIHPTVTLIVAAYNEEHCIEAKLRNCLALDYPPERLHIVVASDGSTDATEAIVQRYAGPRLRLLALPRCGKLHALNAAAGQASGEIIAFSDANVLLEGAALSRLVRAFADAAVGGVCAEKRLHACGGGNATGRGEGLYWRYAQAIKRLEGLTGSVCGADGALYAIRRELFVPLEQLAQVDDFAISSRVVLQGYRLAPEPEALCYEEAPADGRAELRRKVRVANQTMSAILALAAERPRPAEYWWRILSNKVARYAVPILLIGALACGVRLAIASAAAAWVLDVQLLFYALALTGWLLRDREAGRARALSIPFYFTLVNGAALLAWISLLRGRRTVVWNPRGGLGAPLAARLPLRRLS